ncbi:MAG: hypothetical protein ABL930_03910 [Pseudobdellovibrio sp.]
MKNLFKILCLVVTTFSFSVQATDLPFSYSNTKSVHLRNNNLGSPQAIEAGAEITIDPKFLLEMLGSENPTQEQVQRLLLNPGEASKDKVVTQQFRDVNNGKPKNDYFFPVIVKTKTGETKAGKMAFSFYNRTGMLEIKRTDGADPTQFQSSQITAQLRDLIDQNKATEAQSCQQCEAVSNKPTQSIADLARALESSSKDSSNQLWAKYKEFTKEFTAAHRKIKKSDAGQMKRLYIKSLIDKFGQKDAATILAALTAFAEAPYRDNVNAQIAEMSAVLKVVDNRAKSGARGQSRTLKDIGLANGADPLLKAILADWQFSAWNDRDNNLLRILNYTPDRSDAMTNRKMAFAFESQRLMQDGKVEFMGKMNDPKLHHYHANYVNPNWDRAANRVTEPTIKVDGVPVDLSKQRGARHVFYAGLA